ncbi:MAG: hypothetical protein ACK524_24645, partial [Planctomyces sp.]
FLGQHRLEKPVHGGFGRGGWLTLACPNAPVADATGPASALKIARCATTSAHGARRPDTAAFGLHRNREFYKAPGSLTDGQPKAVAACVKKRDSTNAVLQPLA